MVNRTSADDGDWARWIGMHLFSLICLSLYFFVSDQYVQQLSTLITQKKNMKKVNICALFGAKPATLWNVFLFHGKRIMSPFTELSSFVRFILYVYVLHEASANYKCTTACDGIKSCFCDALTINSALWESPPKLKYTDIIKIKHVGNRMKKFF